MCLHCEAFDFSCSTLSHPGGKSLETASNFLGGTFGDGHSTQGEVPSEV